MPPNFFTINYNLYFTFMMCHEITFLVKCIIFFRILVLLLADDRGLIFSTKCFFKSFFLDSPMEANLWKWITPLSPIEVAFAKKFRTILLNNLNAWIYVSVAFWRASIRKGEKDKLNLMLSEAPFVRFRWPLGQMTTNFPQKERELWRT